MIGALSSQSSSHLPLVSSFLLSLLFLYRLHDVGLQTGFSKFPPGASIHSSVLKVVRSLVVLSRVLVCDAPQCPFIFSCAEYLCRWVEIFCFASVRSRVTFTQLISAFRSFFVRGCSPSLCAHLPLRRDAVGIERITGAFSRNVV